MVTGVWVWSSERSVSRAELTLHWVCAAGSYSSPWRGGSPGEGGQGYRRVGWLPTFTQELACCDSWGRKGLDTTERLN